MTNVHRLSNGADADAVYIKGKMAEADRRRANGHDEIAAADALDDEAGNRLVEKKTALDRGVSEAVSKGGRGHRHPFNDWLDANGIDRETARRRMQCVGWSEEERVQAKAKEATRKRESRKAKNALDAASMALQAKGEAPLSREETIALKVKGSLRHVVGDDVDLRDASNAQPVVDAVIAKRVSETDVTRADLSLTMQEKYDRALAKALVDQKATQEATYWKDVNAKALEVMPERMRSIDQKNKEVQRDINILRMGPTAKVLSLEDYRKVLSVLHPDKQPSDADRAEAFNIIRRLDSYVQAANRK